MEWNIREQYVFIGPIPNKELYFVAPNRYLGDRLTSYTKVLSFMYGVFKQHADPEPEPSRKDIIIEGNGSLEYFHYNLLYLLTNGMVTGLSRERWFSILC